MKRRAIIHIQGIVQGVGFRPFIYRVANKLGLKGYVLNLGDAGVRVIVEGDQSLIQELVSTIETRPPSISVITRLSVQWDHYSNEFDNFFIEKSRSKRSSHAAPIIPPDIAICDDCVDDLFREDSRWYEYAFTSCAACGPRYSTIIDLPYDRPNTTMVDFPLCNTCNNGYTDPMDRRYHAQTTACERCGPSYSILDNQGKRISRSRVVQRTAELLDQGFIFAIEGIGGTHIVTKVSDDAPIQLLRNRKRRPQKPFAIMVKDIEALHEFCSPTQFEIELLSSWRRPIVLVKKSQDVGNRQIKDLISPGLDTIGVMLPYSALHHLLFKYSHESAFVMTSANPSGVPMYIEPMKIVKELKGIVDYFLVHNRRIHQRVDDSVIKAVDERALFIRRARGFVPEPIAVGMPENDHVAIAVGPKEKVTGSILTHGMIYTTQHIGDTDNVECVEFLDNALKNLMHLIGVDRPTVIACDLHPDFLTTEYAERWAEQEGVPLVKIQHHHAHLASIMVDNSINANTSIICITADGYGYGNDGSAWGGEILLGNYQNFRKVGGILSSNYLGGDLAARYPIRPLIGFIKDRMSPDEIHKLVGSVPIGPVSLATEDKISIIQEATLKRIKTIMTSSAGRFLDAVAIALGICSENKYDGECPMKLESFALESDRNIKHRFVSDNQGVFVDLSEFLLEVIDMKQRGLDPRKIAYIAQYHLGEALATLACDISDREGVDYIGFSGGVALNRIITNAVVSTVQSRGKIVLLHSQVPPGDGGISIGQAAIAAANLE